METVIGIDPGQTGGICIMRNGRIHALWVMPSSLIELRLNVLNHDNEKTFVFLEKAQSFPGQGISSAFNYGTHYGELRGTLSSMLFSVELVPPSVWARRMHVGTGANTSKTRSLEAARRLFPQETFIPPGTRGKKPHDGLVDAALIALYGWQKLNKPYEGEDERVSDLQETFTKPARSRQSRPST